MKIVMIEDDHGHARLIEKNIRRANIANEIVHFDNGSAAVEYLLDDTREQKGSILILLDLNLPDMSGVDILRKVKGDEALRRAPVVILTTTDDRTEIQHCYDLGCNVYITKPVDYDAFAQAIRQLGLFLSVIQAPVIS
ncbi:response regulator [uncultured Brevundimonas sp.]|uniref:response regulator n=1 Tax=uncultured Brevundimonas sp. TaxID=213418 RepID=UPI00344984FB